MWSCDLAHQRLKSMSLFFVWSFFQKMMSKKMWLLTSWYFRLLVIYAKIRKAAISGAPGRVKSGKSLIPPKEMRRCSSRSLLRDIGDVAKSTATIQRDTTSAVREQSKLSEEAVKVRGELQEIQQTLRAEKEERFDRGKKTDTPDKSFAPPSTPSTPGLTFRSRNPSQMMNRNFRKVDGKFLKHDAWK